MMRLLLIALILILPMVATGQSRTGPGGETGPLYGGGGGGGVGVPGLSGTTGDEQTVAHLYAMKKFAAAGKNTLATVWVDPLNGSDYTGSGTYDSPYLSFRKIKQECLDKPHSHCLVKGYDRWFTHTLLTVSYDKTPNCLDSFDTGGPPQTSGSPDGYCDSDGTTARRVSSRHLLPGETITFLDPVGTAEVLAVYGDKAAVTWLTGADPRDSTTTANTTFMSGLGCADLYDTGGPPQTSGSPDGLCDSDGSEALSESSGTVTAVQDSINGERTWIIDAADITTATDVIAAVGHDFVDSTPRNGPFQIYNEATMPTFSSNAWTDGGDVYVCNVVANTSFQLATDAACSNIVNFTSQGAGRNQLIYGARISGSATTASVLQTIQSTDGCDPDSMCVLFESEFPESPAGLDSGRLYLNGADAEITRGDFWIGMCQDRFDTGGPPQTSGSPDLLCDSDGTTAVGYYNTPVGGLFMLENTVADPAQNGWLGIQNFIVQNVAIDCLAAGAGGKMVALNVKCKGIRNGAGDRSQASTPWPADQGHNSALTAFGENTSNVDNAASVIIWINGDGSWSEMGSDDRSNGFFNVTGNGVGYVISNGVMTQDGISGDTCVGTNISHADNTHGGPCTTAMFVLPGGEVGILGTHLEFEGTTTGDANNRDPFISWTGTGADGDGRIQFANAVIEGRANNTAATQPNVQTFFGWSNGTGDSGKNRSLIARNVTVVAPNGPHVFLGTCALASGATMTVDMKGLILDGWASSSDYMILADCGTIANSLVPVTATFEGIWDQDDRSLTSGCSTGPRFRLSSSSYCIGDEATAGTWMYNIVNTYGVPPGQWKWFVDNSADSGGFGVDGLQWSAGDPHYRCIDGKECWSDDTLLDPDWQFSMRSVFGNVDTTCLPAEVLGTKVCAFQITPTNAAGGR